MFCLHTVYYLSITDRLFQNKRHGDPFWLLLNQCYLFCGWIMLFEANIPQCFMLISV